MRYGHTLFLIDQLEGRTFQLLYGSYKRYSVAASLASQSDIHHADMLAHGEVFYRLLHRAVQQVDMHTAVPVEKNFMEYYEPRIARYDAEKDDCAPGIASAHAMMQELELRLNSFLTTDLD